MSWQLAAFAILALALAGGFAWYERSRPDARVVALVGTLAAFAALGRIAFAATPNVKPTTDIVLIAGYALGAAPGFVVGALAGLTSNFFFGQGPWTPWQMAAWGCTGLIGAGLALIAGRERRDGTQGSIARWPLALLCALVGFGFAAFQDVGDWVNYSDHSAAQLGVYVGKGIGFDVLHAAGCLGFALVFGPALARSLRRFGARLQVSWRGVGVMPTMLAALVAVGAIGLAWAPTAGASSTRSYLLSAQNPDGGFGSAPGDSSSQLYTGWTALGLAALGNNPADVQRGRASELDYVRSGVGSISDTGSLERTILVVRAAGASARSFGGHDLIAALSAKVRGDGSLEGQVNLTAFGVLALRSAGVSVPASTVSWLATQQNPDGGFSFASAGGGSDIDDTGAALQALAGMGGSAAAADARGVRFLRARQNLDGGFPAQPGGESNAQSTAWAVQGLIAAGVDPAVHRGGAVSPLEFLHSLTDSDGHVHYSRTSDQTPVWVTAQAAMALAGRPLPLAPVGSVGGTAGAGAGGFGSGSGSGSGVHSASVRGSLSRAKAATRRARVGRAAAGARLLELAGDAGGVTALLLAPVGLG